MPINDGQKHSIQFYNSASVETDKAELNYVVIAATDQMLDEIGGLILASGARFPSNETVGLSFKFNKITAQELIWIGLQLMGASQLDFDADWSDSPDSDFHAEFEQNIADKGHWSLHLEKPEIIGEKGDKGDKGDTAEQGIQGIQGVPGHDGSDGIDGSDGVDGMPGIDGVDGLDGNTVLSGNGVPSDSLGVNGDFYLDLLSTTLYGPKVSGSWPEFGVILKGSDGENGTNGSDGIDGSDGVDGTDCDCATTIPDPSHESGATLRCSVANFIGQSLKNQWDHYIDDDHATANALTSGTASLITMGALLLVPEVAVAVTLFSIIGAAIANLELSSIYSLGKASFSETVIAEVSKDLFCVLGEDGKITDSVKSAWHDAIMLRSTSTADVYDLAATRFVGALPVQVYQIFAMKAPLLANADACSGYHCNEITLQFKNESSVNINQFVVDVGTSVDIPFYAASAGYISVMVVPSGKCISFTLTGLPYYTNPDVQQHVTHCDNTGVYYNDVDLPSTITDIKDFVFWSNGSNGILTMHITDIHNA